MSKTATDSDLGWLDAELATLRDLDAQAAKKGSAFDKGNARLKALLTRCGFPSMEPLAEVPPADFDEKRLLPRAEDLTPLQRRVVMGLMDLERIHAGPEERAGEAPSAATLPLGRDALSRWLGLQPAGALETLVPFSISGPTRQEPLWRALRALISVDTQWKARQPFLAALPLPLRLRAAEETAFYGPLAAYGLETDTLIWLKKDFALFDRIDASCLPWAREVAIRWSARLEDDKKLKDRDRIWHAPNEVTIPIFAALLAAKEPIPPAWDCLIPMLDGSLELSRWGERALAALPPERRLAQALRLFALEIPNEYRFELGLRVFRELPEPALFKLLKRELTNAFGSADAAEKKQLKAALADLEKVAPSATAKPASKGESPPKQVSALVLRSCIEVTAKTPLTPIQTKQILKAGEAYFEEKRSLKKLLSEDEGEGDSFHGNLELRTLATVDGKSAYDLVHVMGDSGLIFEAGKTKVVAQIVQDGIEDCEDERLAEALEKGLQLSKEKTPRGASSPRRK